MRGRPLFNFPAFEAAEKHLEILGYDVTSPHRLDIDAGFDPTTTEVTPGLMEAMARRDIEAILKSDVLAIMEGWGTSVGAKAEFALARWLNKEIFSYPSMQPMDNWHLFPGRIVEE